MRRYAVSTVLAIVLAFSAVRISADSVPSLSGIASGIELCPQFICGFALFAGQFKGEVNSHPAKGSFSAAIVHQDLPAIGGTAAILGGEWTITAGRRLFTGNVTNGTLLNLNGTQFCVTMTMELTGGGTGEVFFSGVLDHGPFPPTIAGYVTQSPAACPIGS